LNNIVSRFQHSPYLLVEQYPGPDYKLEDVLQRFHSFKELVSDPTLLGVIHVRF